MIIDPENNRRLQHILEATKHIADFLDGVSKEEFENDYEKQSAVIRQFEIIGESAGRLSPDFTKKHKEIEWSKVIGMRHKMIHDYFDVDVNIVWTTATDDTTLLKIAIKKILE